MNRRPRIAISLLDPALLGLGLILAVTLAAILTAEPGWVAMWTIAGGEFFALKFLTLAGLWRAAPRRRVLGYLLLWPGMNARAFLGPEGPRAGRPAGGELIFALGKMTLGLASLSWAVAQAGDATGRWPAWIGMIGIIFTLHFGLLHLGSWLWRRAGHDAPPIMRAPILATSLTEFWSERWNLAFADAARRLVFRPLARRWGAAWASATVFLLSGLVHETVVSLPARGGWGGPTLYFLLQAGGAWFERSRWGRAGGLGRGWRGWGWTLVVTLAPLPLLFHGPFASRVIEPFLIVLKGVVP